MSPRTCRDRDRGSATLELVALAPALLALVLFMIAAGRIGSAKSQVEEAARDGARAASLARSLDAATTAARAAVLSNLRASGSCAAPSLGVSGDFTRPAGAPSEVQVTVSCSARLADIALPGLPGTKRLTASYAAPIDSFRGDS
jgi:Flp pilus assembly protein TadG